MELMHALRCLFNLIFILDVTLGKSFQQLLRTAKFESEKDYYIIFEAQPEAAISKRSVNERPGSATDTHSCDYIRDLPPELRKPEIMYPEGLTGFYSKYTEAYGIPIVGSSRVSNDALHRACYVARFIFADIYAIRNSLYKRFGRFAIIGTNEKTTDIPEHSWLPDWWNQRARGLGATDKLPVSTAGEENALCSHYDIYIREDIVLHEYAHALHLLGAHYAVPDFREKLSSVFASARLRGLWDNTYASTNQIEYFAEGVQKYFNDDSHSDPPNGIHNHVNTRAKLRDYDIGLHDLIQSLFPCNNQYLLRCDKRRDKELHQKLRINCDGNGGAGGGDSEETGGDGEEGGEGGGSEGGRGFQEGDCQDEHRLCSYWALMGECPHNPGYMHINCRQSCSLCDEETTDEGQSCYDNYRNCAGWARYGECEKNPEYMLKHCRMSCGHCDNNETDKCRDSDEVTHCSSWTRLGYCHHSKFRESMEYYCKRTCNFC